MEEIKLTLEELDSLKEVSYFRGVVITSLKEIRGNIVRIDKHLEISNGTVLAVMKKQERLDTYLGIHSLLILLIIGAAIKVAFF